MDELELPFMPIDAALGAAIESLRRTGGRALVAKQAHGLVVLRADELIEHWNALDDSTSDDPEKLEKAMRAQAAATLGQVVPRSRPVPLPDELAALGDRPASLAAEGYQDRLVDMFRASDERYAVRDVRGDVARVITASERFASDLRPDKQVTQRTAARIVACKGQPVHYWDTSEVGDINVCKKPHWAAIVKL